MMFLLPFVFLLLIACSDNLLPGETKSLSIERISVEVQGKSDTVLTDYSSPYIDTILTDDTISFYAKVNPNDALYSCLWFIESKEEPCRQTKKYAVFDSVGLYQIKLRIQDIFEDTLSASIFMRVSSKPICEKINLDVFQGSPIFKWNCQNTDTYSDELDYKFILKTKDKSDTLFLKEDSLQLGYSLPDDYWEVQLEAKNSYGFKDSIGVIFNILLK